MNYRARPLSFIRSVRFFSTSGSTPTSEPLEPRRLLAAELASDVFAPGLNTGQDGEPEFLVTMNGAAYFAGFSPYHGREVVRSDGTAGGTVVLDAIPGGAGLNPNSLFNANGTLFFLGNDGVHGQEMWKSDGTTAGTVMVKDIVPGSASGLSTFTAGRLEMAQVNGIVYFKAADRTLWRSDGTDAGTYRLAPSPAAFDATQLTPLGSKLLFTAAPSATGRELWVTDGTAAGTTIVKDIRTGSASGLTGLAGLTAYGGHAYFDANDGSGYRLWRSDGTAVGTTTFLNHTVSLANTAQPDFCICGGNLWFVAGELGGNPDRLWRTDGTVTGTSSLPYAAQTDSLADFNGTLYFTIPSGTDPDVHKLYKTSGTVAGTQEIAGGTQYVPRPLGAAGGVMYFAAGQPNATGTTGREVYRIDPTQTSLALIEDLNPGPAGNVYEAAPLGNALLFVFLGQLQFEGLELYRSDGTAPGTHIVKDLAFPASSAFPRSLAVSGDSLFFRPQFSFGSNNELWKMGTNHVSTFVREINPSTSIGSDPDYLTDVGGTIFFAANPGSGHELWRSNGTSGGTARVTTLVQFANLPSTPYPNAVLAHNGLLYFGGTLSSGGGLWSATASSATQLVNSGNVAHSLARIGEDIYFSSGNNIYKSTGGAQPVITAPGHANLIAANGKLFFTVGAQLWTSDGTQQGTSLVTTISGGFGTHLSRQWLDVSGRLFFAASDGAAGIELWTSDGTPSGTVMLKDIAPAAMSSAPDWMLDRGGILYFIANDQVHGRELWRSDGTPLGTVRVDDFYAGSGDMSPKWLTLFNGERIYFAGFDYDHGGELFVTTPAFAVLDARTLSIAGSGASDTFTLTRAGATISVTLGAQTLNFAAADVDDIVVSGGAGDDAVNVDSELGAARFTFNGGAGASVLNINAGSMEFAADARAGSQELSINVASGASVEFRAAQHLSSLNVTGAALLAPATGAVLVTRAVSVTGAGYLDVGDNGFVVDYTGASPAAAIRALLRSGWAGGAWTGPGIRSSTAAASAGTAIGYGEATELFSAFPATFLGQSIDATAVVARYTLAGDANLDRRVNLNDFNVLAANFGQANRTFTRGDFNYDGVVNLEDFNILASRFGAILAAPTVPATPRDDLLDDLLA